MCAVSYTHLDVYKRQVFQNDDAKPREMILLIKLNKQYPINVYRKMVRFPSVCDFIFNNSLLLDEMRSDVKM